MKTFLCAIILFFFLNASSQTQFEIIHEGNTKILKGIIDKELIVNDTSFTWYAQNQSGYSPSSEVVSALKAKGPQIQLIAFGGTWCGDTKFILPKFFSILEAAAFPADHLTLMGVDRSKKTISHLAEALNVTNVPTFIVLKDGREIGRVVEYGKTGQWEKELAQIFNSVK